jgi:hypothetical protein
MIKFDYIVRVSYKSTTDIAEIPWRDTTKREAISKTLAKVDPDNDVASIEIIQIVD